MPSRQPKYYQLQYINNSLYIELQGDTLKLLQDRIIDDQKWGKRKMSHGQNLFLGHLKYRKMYEM